MVPVVMLGNLEKKGRNGSRHAVCAGVPDSAKQALTAGLGMTPLRSPIVVATCRPNAPTYPTVRTLPLKSFCTFRLNCCISVFLKFKATASGIDAGAVALAGAGGCNPCER